MQVPFQYCSSHVGSISFSMTIFLQTVSQASFMRIAIAGLIPAFAFVRDFSSVLNLNPNLVVSSLLLKSKVEGRSKTSRSRRSYQLGCSFHSELHV
jgi:hypothetical protein